MAEFGSLTLFDNLRNLISLIDSLRDLGVQEYISLPRIAVLGTQSAGKSSLLESIVGMDFLPRGDGVVTRRPLELRLSRTRDAVTPWGVFKDNPKKYTDFNEIRTQIEALTDQVCGSNKNIIDDPIILTIYSADCPDLTIIDLPGITRIPYGDQPKNIKEITKKMVTNYCKDPKTIILTVIPGNQDLSTSDALQMAMELDPEGKRTIGVITKIDIMDSGTDASSVLNNEEIPLRLGYVGVKGRSQAAIKNKTKVRDALKEEAKYFSEHPTYSSLPPEVVGTQALINKLTTVLYTLIKENLPALKNEIVRKKEECGKRLKELGPGLPVGEKDKFEFVWQLADDLCNLFISELQGKYDLTREEMNKKKKRSLTSNINAEFDEYFEDFATIKFSVTDKHTDDEIYNVLTTYQGDNLPGFPSMDAFLFLMLPKLEMLKQPTFELLDKIHEKLDTTVKEACAHIFKRFPAIEMEIYDIIQRDLNLKKEDSRNILRTLLECEENYLFTNDTDYISDNLHKYNDDSKKKKEIENTIERGKMAVVSQLRKRINAYFFIVSRNLKDSIPKIIGTFLIQAMMKDIKFVLFNNISKAGSFLQRMTEPSDIANERATLSKQFDVLKKAERRILSDPALGGMGSSDDDIYEVLAKKNDEFKQNTLSNLREKESMPEVYGARDRSEPIEKQAARPVDNQQYKKPDQPQAVHPSQQQQSQPNPQLRKPTSNNLFGDVNGRKN